MFFASISIVNATESNFNGEENTSIDSVNDIFTNSDIKSNTNSSINSENNSKNSNSTSLNIQNSSKNSSNTIISGKILNCNNDNPFKGATIYIKSLSGETLVTTISDANGNYRASFYSLDSKFYVLATYPGHVYPSETISVSQSGDMRYGVANLRFGNLSLSKGSTDLLVYNSANIAAGLNQTLVQITITNNALTTATNVWANFTWTSSNTNINLVTGQSFNQFIGDIGPGQTVNVFFLVGVSSGVLSGDSRSYNISVSGSNTGTPIDSIIGNIVATPGVGSNRNMIVSVAVNDTNPSVGSFIAVTVLSSSPSNSAWVNLPIEFDPSILKLISINTTLYPNGQSSTNVTQIGTGQTGFLTVWVFQVIGASSTNLRPWVSEENPGGSHFYNSNIPPTVTVNGTTIADLAITKTANATYPRANDIVTFTITVRNYGPSNATGVNVVDIMGSGMVFISASPSVGTYNPTTGNWAIGNLNANNAVTLTITVRILATGNLSNIAHVSGNEYDPYLYNNYAIVVLSPTENLADLAVSKTVDNYSPVNGGTVVFTITVVNNGPDTAINSRLTDSLPNGLILTGWYGSQGTYDPSTGLWSIGNLTYGAHVTLILICRVNGTGYMTNTVNVSSDTRDPLSINNNASVTINAQPSADLGVVKTVNNENPLVNELINYTIAVRNYGPNDATGVYVIDIFPENVTYISSNSSAFDPNTGIWTIGNLANGETVYLIITVRVDALGPNPNIAIVQGNEYDPNYANDMSTVTIDGQPNADLAIAKTADRTTYNNGDTLIYTIVVTNNGPNTAENVTVRDYFPSGLIFVSANGTMGFFDPNTYIWTIGNLTNGETVTLTIIAKINQSGVITNVVYVNSDTSDYNILNNFYGVTITVYPTADLKVVKTANASNVTVGSLVTFTIVIYNLGPDTATGVTLVDRLPYGLVYLSSSGGTYDPATGIWRIGTITSGSYITLNIVSIVNTTSSKMNIATVYGNEYDPSTLNNYDFAMVNGIPVANLSVIKSSDKNTYNVGDTITYTIKVTNNGPSNATGVYVLDKLHNSLEFVKVYPSIGSYNPKTGIWTIGSLALGEVATLIIDVKALKAGKIVNRVETGSDISPPVFSEVEVTVKDNETNDTNQTNGTNINQGIVAGMKKTGTPLIAVMVILLSIVEICIRKIKFKLLKDN